MYHGRFCDLGYLPSVVRQPWCQTLKTTILTRTIHNIPLAMSDYSECTKPVPVFCSQMSWYIFFVPSTIPFFCPLNTTTTLTPGEDQTVAVTSSCWVQQKIMPSCPRGPFRFAFSFCFSSLDVDDRWCLLYNPSARVFFSITRVLWRKGVTRTNMSAPSSRDTAKGARGTRTRWANACVCAWLWRCLHQR